ncbi:MAG TPA: aminotransferase class III-fold pyridoxal phosphate-dependent enzyme [Bryobacteraceae bacterium]|jgi:4-aminobutyrate aminotransferase-like enzyme/Ser/Thr protein kinase RdoA (MazF antagonist)|nr:aminotransferase class III-fold pyridoxal phosphate-dependent enzyme [Bryobacteraceae bacterium]
MQIDASRIAKELYGIDAVATRLNGEFDDNFHLKGPSEYILKVMREGCDRAFVEMQCGALEHLGESRVAGGIREYQGRIVWLLRWIPGKLLADTKYHSPKLLRNFGRLMARTDAKLATFDHLSAHKELKWDLKRAFWIREYLHLTADRSLIERILAMAPDLSPLRHSVIHGDANDHNVLINGDDVTLIDFGDLHYTATVSELAIASAYVALNKKDPLIAIGHVVAGYALTDPSEIAALFPLILLRLAVSVVNSAHRKSLYPNDSYITVSEKSAWEGLRTLSQIHPRLANYVFRQASGLKPLPDWTPRKAAPILQHLESAQVLDLSVGNATEMPTPSTLSIGGYNEARLFYTEPMFEGRTIHLGLDVFEKPGTPIFAPFDGTVYATANNAKRLDYGPVMILQHESFFTLYGHLAETRLAVGTEVKAGQEIARIGDRPGNGDWPPHLHFQIIRDLLDLDCDFPGVASPELREVYTAISPDPNSILQLSMPKPRTKEETLAARREHIGGNLSISYEEPLKIVRGWKQFLYDDTGRAFLDVYNNVPLVGHSHPRVVEAVQKQIAVLNTNTRYLHDNIVQYAERLTAKLPALLRICYFLNSASEANELALRLARTHTIREDIIVLDAAYHGNTTTLIDISPYKFNGPGGKGKKPWVHVAPIPDDYRGPYKRTDPEAGAKYARQVAEILDGVKPAAFIAESLPSVGGQIVFPPGYLRDVYKSVRDAGGVCIADEVQVGFGRLGRWFFGFEMQGVTPDIVVLGKPIGNGFPLAAVITTEEIAASFDNGMEFFSTFGGNPVACAAGLAVLDVLEEEKLQENALMVGDYLLRGLRSIDNELIGDVRGSGLFLGVELVRDRVTLEPASAEASRIANRLRERGILAGTDGPYHNVIKLRPPLCFTREDADRFVSVLEEVM